MFSLVIQIKWLYDPEDPELQERLAISVDGVHCKIWEPRTDPSTKWYSQKSNGAGLAYEVGVALWHNQIVWINGPFPAGNNDTSIFKSELKQKMADCGIKGLADRGYNGHYEQLSTKNEYDSQPVARFKQRALGRHETVNSRLKHFKILSDEFRGKGPDRLEKHKTAFEACAVIVQYEMENGQGLFKI